MTFLGVNLVAARDLVTRMRRVTGATESPYPLAVQAQLLAGVALGATGLLDEIDNELRIGAARVEAAVGHLDTFALVLPHNHEPLPTPVPLPAPSNEPEPTGRHGLYGHDWHTCHAPEPTPVPLSAPPNEPEPTGRHGLYGLDWHHAPEPTPVPLPAPANGPEPTGRHVLQDRDRHLMMGPLAAPVPTLWNAHPHMPWNQVRQESSHNTYAVAGGILNLFHNGVRSFELDIHRGVPTDFTPAFGPLSLVSPLLAIAYDHIRHDGGVADDWQVYHVSGDSDSAYALLSDGLNAVVALDSTEPITIFVDNKDPFGGSHTSLALDRLVRSELGDRLYTPNDLLERAPGATNLQQAVSMAGWPTVAELDGRIMVVLTGELEGYATKTPALFVAPAPIFNASTSGDIHVPEPNTVFYNAEFTYRGEDRLRAIQANGNLVRTYVNPRCGSLVIESGQELLSIANYRAADLDVHDTPCPSAMPYPPEGTPVPR